MKYSITVVFFILYYFTLFSQSNVGIGTFAPNASSILELSATNKGLLIPRVKLKGPKNQMQPINNPVTPLLVFNSRDTVALDRGFYFWNDTIWTPIITSANFFNYESTDWRLKGNAVGTADFLGTTNSGPIKLRLNNIHAGSLSIANLSIGSNSMASAIPGSENVALGKNALQTCFSTKRNTAVGDNALQLFNDDGTGENTAVGYNSLKNNAGNSAVFNTAVGKDALLSNIGGFSNTSLGSYSDVGSGGLGNATAIGFEAVIDASNAMAFGNGTVEKWCFGRQNTPANQALKVGTAATNGNGAYLTDGGVWTNTSDVNLKDDISILSKEEILQKIMQMSVTKWKYKGTDEYHIGPMAQDFYALFNVGLDNTSISTVDPSGIALIAIQQLKKENDEMKNTIMQIQVELNKLKEK